jgi:hypothetical protein
LSEKNADIMELSNLVEEVFKQEGTAVKQLAESKFVTYYMLCKINKAESMLLED